MAQVLTFTANGAQLVDWLPTARRSTGATTYFAIQVDRGGTLGGGTLKLEPSLKTAPVVGTDNDWASSGDAVLNALTVGTYRMVEMKAVKMRLVLSGATSPSFTVRIL